MDKILTVREPFASSLVHGIKKAEYRSWKIPAGSKVWIHAALQHGLPFPQVPAWLREHGEFPAADYMEWTDAKDDRPRPPLDSTLTQAIYDSKGLPGFSVERDHWRKHYECDLVAYGFRSDESVSRSVIMRQWPDGINAKSHECYPLKRWNRSIVAAYASQIKAPMAEEYQYGFRDCGEQFTGTSAVWLHDTHPNDFQTACAFDPMLAAEYTRATGLPA